MNIQIEKQINFIVDDSLHTVRGWDLYLKEKRKKRSLLSLIVSFFKNLKKVDFKG